jgi:hypothetical protein
MAQESQMPRARRFKRRKALYRELGGADEPSLKIG